MRTALALLAAAVVVGAAVLARRPWAARPPADEGSRLASPGWRDRHEAYLRRAAAGPVDLLFLGDSITRGWADVPAVWGREYGDKRAAQFGIDGDTAQDVLWRVTAGGELDRIDPRVVVLLVGTNNFGRHDATPAAAAEAVGAVVRAIREKRPGCKLLLLGLFPRDADPNTDYRRRIAATNARLAELGDERAVFYRDIGGRFLDADGRLPIDVMPDALHLSAKGYQLWADAIRADLAEFMKD